MKKNILELATSLKVTSEKKNFTFLNNRMKRGSSVVFLGIILAAILAVVLAFISSSQRVATIGYANSVLTLAHNSVLSEYSIELKNHYGLFAFNGTNSDVESKIAYYSNYSFSERENIKLENVKVDVSSHSLGDINVAKEQMIEHGQFALARKIFKSKNGKTEIDGVNLEGAESGLMQLSGDGRKERKLSSKGILNTLPSKGYGGSDSILGKISGITKLEEGYFDSVTGDFLINQYILNSFGSYVNVPEHETFFKGEVEYILGGENSDSKNYKELKNEIRVLRNLVNLGHIVTDAKKMNLISTAAKATGPAAPATALVLLEAWALAEANNDIKLLEHGKLVPFVKTNETWAIDFDIILKNKPQGYIDTKAKTGLSYEGYLMFFLGFMDENVKVARALDLIQINMQGLYDSNFLIMEHNTGFYVTETVNGKEYVYEDKY